MEKFIKEKLEVDCRIVECRNSGPVIVAKVENEDKKKEIMSKSRLKGERIFIENDLSWDERKVQEKISGWARERRREGVKVKIGYGRVKVACVWKDLEMVEREEREGSRRGEERRRDRDGLESEEGTEKRNREGDIRRVGEENFG